MSTRVVNRIPYPYGEFGVNYHILDRLRFGIRGTAGEIVQTPSVQLRAGWSRCVWLGGEFAPQDFPENTIPGDLGDPFSAYFAGFNDKVGDIWYSGVTAESLRAFYPLGLAPHNPLSMERPADGVGDRLGFYYMTNELFPGERATSQAISIVLQATPATVVPPDYFYPSAVANGFNGVLFGSIHGLTGKALYVGFEEPAPGVYNLRIMGPPDWTGNRSPNLLVSPIGDPDELWTPFELYAYQIIWDPVKGTVDVFGSGQGEMVKDESIRIASIPLEDVNTLRPGIHVGGVQYNEPVPRLTTIFGTDGTVLTDNTLMLSIGATPIVKGMVINGTQMGGFPYLRTENASVSMVPTVLPEKLDVAWMRPIDGGFPEFDPSYVGTEGPTSVDVVTEELVLAKTAPAEHNIFFRQEHSIGLSTALTGEVEFVARGVNSVHGGIGTSNMGFRIVFSDRYFNLEFLGFGGNLSVGILDSAGASTNIGSYSAVAVDWTQEHHYRVVFDAALAKIALYLDQALEPSLEVNTVDLPATIAPVWPVTVVGFGHLDPLLDTSGEFRVARFTYAFMGKHYEAREGVVPGAGWSLLGTGATPSVVTDRLQIADAGYGLSTDYSLYKFDLWNYPLEGLTIDFKMSVTDWVEPAGGLQDNDAVIPAGIAHYNGVNWLYLMFVTNSRHGKFLVVPGYDYEDDLEQAQAHTERGREISARVDWEEEHEYRVVRSTNGIDVFVDDMLVPVLSLPANYRLPITSPFGYGGVPAMFFGSLDPEAATTSLWRFVRVYEADGVDYAVTPGGFNADELSRVWGGRGTVLIEAESL